MNWTDKIQVYNEDCMETMSRYEDGWFDLAIVDIPYGLGDKLTSGGTWANKYKKGDADWDKLPPPSYFNELFRVSKNQIIWGGNYAQLPPCRCFFIWDKLSHMPTMADCEMAWTSFDKNAKIFKHPRNTSEKRIHITQKPIKLYNWILDRYAKPDFKIIDTHLGSGSHAISCHYFDCELVAAELDTEYYNDSYKRFKEATAQQKLF